MSQKYVAISLGVSAPTVSMWESGAKEPTRENLIKLADLFGVSVDYLLGRDEIGAGGASLSPSERQLLHFFKQLNDAGQALALKNVRNLLEEDSLRKEATAASAV